MNGTLVLGIGNIFLSDEAVGVRVIEALQQRFNLPDNLDVIDGGTCGFELMPDMANRDHLIVVDAVLASQPAGSMLILKDEEVPAVFTRKISPHQLGLADVLSALKMTDEFPPKITLIGIVPKSMDFKIELSNTVERSKEQALETLVQLLQEQGFQITPKLAS